MVRNTNPVSDDGSDSPKDVCGGEEILVRAWEKVSIHICQRHEQASPSECGGSNLGGEPNLQGRCLHNRCLVKFTFFFLRRRQTGYLQLPSPPTQSKKLVK